MSERHYLHVFSTFEPGGPQVRTAELINAMPRGTRHTIIAMDRRAACAERLGDDVRVELCDPPAAARRGVLASGRAFAGVLRDLRPDLLLTYNWGAIEALLGARFARLRRVVHHEEGFGPEEVDRFLKRRIWLRRALFRRVPAIVVPSRVLERIAARVWRQPPGRVRYLPNGVDLERFRPAAAIRPEPIVVGTVGGIRGEKNQALLVSAFARLTTARPTRLVLVGDGPDLSAVRALAGELGVEQRVDFTGGVPDTASFYSRMAVFALSSRTEQMPLVVLEAMASGLPIASTDVGDVRQMVAEPNREFVVPPGDADALAQALDRLVEDPGLRARLGAANRARVEECYDREVCYARYLELYDAVSRGAS